MLSRKFVEEDTLSRLSSGGHWLGWGGCLHMGTTHIYQALSVFQPPPFYFPYLYLFFYSFSAAKEITAALNLHNTRFGWKKCESENVQVYTLECAGNSAQGHTKQYKLWNFLKSVCKVDAGCQRIRYLFFVEVCRCQHIEILIRIKCDEGDLYEVSEMVIFWKRWKVVDGKWILLCFHFHVTTSIQSFCMDYLISVFEIYLKKP